MGTMRSKPEKVAAKLRKLDVLVPLGRKVSQAIPSFDLTEVTSRFASQLDLHD